MENKVEVPIMSESQFTNYIESFKYQFVNEAAQKFKSIRRAIKRGLISPSGIIFPTRPFNNRYFKTYKKKGKKSLNDFKKIVYGKIKQKRI